MKINTTIWIDWENQRVVTSEDEKEAVKENAIDEGECDCTDFESWLDENYCASEVYNCSEDELISEYEDWKRGQSEEWFNDYFETYPIEIEAQTSISFFVQNYLLTKSKNYNIIDRPLSRPAAGILLYHIPPHLSREKLHKKIKK